MGKSVEELAAELELDLRPIPVDLIDPDPDNPNEVSDAQMETLTADIRDHGFTQPVLVREGEDGRFGMIDGEHRWRIVKGLGYATVPGVVIKAGDDEAKIRLLTMNGLRGTFVPIKMAYFLQDLASRIPEAELRRRLGMEQSEMKDLLRLAEFTDPMGERLREATEREAKDAPTVLKFVVSKRDAQAVERVIDTLVKGKIDRGTALAKVCREYERAQREGSAPKA